MTTIQACAKNVDPEEFGDVSLVTKPVVEH